MKTKYLTFKIRFQNKNIIQNIGNKKPCKDIIFLYKNHDIGESDIRGKI